LIDKPGRILDFSVLQLCEKQITKRFSKPEATSVKKKGHPAKQDDLFNIIC